MTLAANKYAIPNGAPVGLKQKMKSGSWGETAGIFQNDNYAFPTVDDAVGSVMTTDGAGVLTLKPIPTANAILHKAVTSSQSPPPGSGNVRWNNATQINSTLLYMSYINEGGVDVEAYMQSIITAGSSIIIQASGDQSQFQRWDVVSVVEQAAHLDIEVTLVDSALGNFSNNKEILSVILQGTSAASFSQQLSSAQSIVNKSAARNIYRADLTSASFTLDLPPVSAVSGQVYTFIKIDTSDNKLTLDADGTEKINGVLTDRLVSQFDSVTLLANGDEWFVLNEHFNSKTLFVDRDGSGSQVIASGSPVVVEFNNVVVDVGDFFDDVTNFDWTPGNGIFELLVSLELEQLDSNDFVEVCVRKNGTNIVCQRMFATANNQDVTVRLMDFNSNTDPSPGVYDVTIEHNQGGNLNLSDDPIRTLFKVIRIA